MQVLVYLIPISLLLGGAGLVAFVYTVRSNQYDDPDGNAQRILSDAYDDEPKS
jgi:cbb3-type cytochrome oxidase maturation protein